MSQELRAFLATRRSVKPAQMTGPGPSADELQTILTIGARVPDHKMMVPWRFVVFEGEARARFGEALVAACKAEEKEPPSDVRLETERARFLQAPLVVAVISRVNPVPAAPEWEQVLSAGAACYNLCLAANSYGYASNWLTGWYSYSPGIRRHLKLAENERIAGFVHIGRATDKPSERPRPDMAAIVSRY